jgi:hypothetical protein
VPLRGASSPAASRSPLEQAALLREVDRLRRGAEDRHAGGLEALREAERGLAAELHDDADQFAALALGVDDLEHVLEGERLEVEPVGGVVVGRDGLRVAVDHDRLEPGIGERERRVHAGVVELDPLADPVRARAEDHDLATVARRDLGLLVVARVVVRRERRELPRAGVDRLEDRAQLPRPVADAADLCLADATELADLVVAEPVVLRQVPRVGVQLGGIRDIRGHLVDEHDLVDEPGVDAGRVEDLLDGRAGQRAPAAP